MISRSLFSVFLMGLLIIAVILSGCGGSTVSVVSDNNNQNTNVNVNENVNIAFSAMSNGDEVVMTKPDGSAMSVSDLEKLTDISIQNDLDIDFAVEGVEDVAIAQVTGEALSRAEFRIGKFLIRTRFDKHQIVAPCLNRNWVPHFNLDIKDLKRNRWVAKIHLMVWKDKGGPPKFGYWNNTSGYCVTSDATYDQVRQRVNTGLKKIAVPSSAAWAAAGVLAGIVIYALVPLAVVAGQPASTERKV